MLQHHHANPTRPMRVVVLGAFGFMGRNLLRHLTELGVETLPVDFANIDVKFPSQSVSGKIEAMSEDFVNVDLTQPESVTRLQEVIREEEFKMSHRALRAAGLVLVVALTPALSNPATATEPAFEVKQFQGLEYRSIGPFRGGRVTAVSGVVQDRRTFYMGSTGGGIWKTDDGGTSWRPVADGQLGSASVGALAVAPSDQDVMYALAASNVGGPGGHFDQGLHAVFRSGDGGATWSAMVRNTDPVRLNTFGSLSLLRATAAR